MTEGPMQPPNPVWGATSGEPVATGLKGYPSAATGPRQLTAAQMDRLTSYGVAQEVQANDVLFRPGDSTYDLVVVESGQIDIVRPPTHSEPEAVVTSYEAGGFLGELNLLTGQSVYLIVRVIRAGRIHRIAPDQFRRLMAEDPELSDILLRTFLSRRDALRTSHVARGIEIVGSGMSSEALALRTYAARQRLPHVWLDVDSVAGEAILHFARLSASDLPAVILHDRILRRAQPGALAEALGLHYRWAGGAIRDLTVIGSGPAGLAAAVYGASEGLSTLALDSVGIGGQAAASSRIENYVGFPSGLSGFDLTQRAALQAMKFGAELSSPCEVVAIDNSGGHPRVQLSDGTEISTRSVVIATGAKYRSLPIPNWHMFEGAGIYYAATDLEARACVDRPVAVVGGANSAGQAALFLASRGCSVTLVVRGADIAARMSAYLVDRLQHDDRVRIEVNAEVTGVHGESSLESISLTRTTNHGPVTAQRSCVGLFCFIGAQPATGWLAGVALDKDGFVRTDIQLDAATLGPLWSALGRQPLPFETNVPAVFAAGDVRVGSMKRVASAVGEGASAIRSVHTAIGLRA